MALKSALNIGALPLILSLEAVAAGSFLIPAEAFNSPANIVQRASPPQLPLNWQTVQPAESSGSRPNNQQIGATWNSFQPPQDGVPGRREGGGTRSLGLECPMATTALTALIPQSTMGQTISAKPTFFYYLPVALDKTVQFELADQRDKTLYKKSFRMVTSRAGIVSVSLASDDNSPALEVGKNYQWYFTIKCNPKNTTDDVLVSGWINRTALAPTVKTELDRSSDLTKLSIFAQQSLWYEYLATLAQLRLQSPNDASLAIKWSAVLKSVELDKIAQEPLVASELTPITRK